MNWKKVLRIAVCLVLVCTLVVGISPIRAKAAYVPAVTEATIIGVLLYSLLYSSGMIIEPPDHIQDLDDAAESFERYIYNNMTFGSEFPGDDDEDKRDKLWEELERTAVKVKDKLHSETWTPKDRLIYNLGTLGVVAACDFLWDCIENGYFTSAPSHFGFTGLTCTNDRLFDMYSNMAGCNFPFFGFLKECGVAENVLIHSGVSSRLYGLFFDSNGILTHGLFANPYGDFNASYCGMYSLGSLELVNSFHASYPTFYSTSYASSYPGFLSMNCYALDWGSNGLYLDSYGQYYFKAYCYVKKSSDAVFSGSSLQTIYTGYDSVSDDGFARLNPAYCFNSFSTDMNFYVPAVEVGPIVEGIKSGALKAADIPIPEAVDFTSIFEGIETSGVGAISNNLANKATEISNGSLSIDDFRESITYTDSSGDDSEDPTEVPGATDGVEDPDNPGDGSEGNEQIPTDVTLSNFPVLNFFARLGQLLQDIMNGNLLGIKNFFNPWFESIGQWFQDIRGDIFGVRDDLSDIDSSVEDIVDSNSEQNNILEQGFSAVSSVISGAISNAAGDIVDAVKSTVVPEEDFLTNNVNALCDEFSFADSIVKTGQSLHLGLANISTEPPVIYIDLGASRGSHYLGGQVPFLDLRWYAEYKPTVDTIISAFLWICFVWKMFLNLPGIISGMPGDFNAHAAESMGVVPYLPARSAEYEHIRVLNRRSMHRRE